MIVTEDEVQRIYRKRFSDRALITKARTWEVIVKYFLSKWIRPGDTVLDLGCGYGEFLNYVKASRRIGVDINPDSSVHLDKNIEFFQKGVCDLNFLADDSVDLVFSSNLIEHLPGKREVEQMVREARRVLRPGGHLVMMGPNIRMLPGKYWDFWDHIVPVSDRSLHELLDNLEFDVIDLYPKFLPYTTRSWIPKHPFFVRLYLRFPLVWQIMGKQFLIRARKPSK
ncbi:MAG TPA: class I SAM-dependent methyltransferase [Tepidisphaeraceae bacterium]|nr:class I SAM-dependent methyltransferase [Tepidisphaeraceae bacterium]